MGFFKELTQALEVTNMEILSKKLSGSPHLMTVQSKLIWLPKLQEYPPIQETI